MRLARLVLSTLLLLLVPLRASDATGSDGEGCGCKRAARRSPLGPLASVGLGAGVAALLLSVSSDRETIPLVEAPKLTVITSELGSIPQNAMEGVALLAVGARPPDTATALPTLMLVAAVLMLAGIFYSRTPRRRHRRLGWRRRARNRADGVWRLRSVYRRRIGLAIASVGMLLLVIGGKELVEGAGAQARARQEWQTMYASLDSAVVSSRGSVTEVAMSRDSVSRRETSTVAGAPDGLRLGAPVARLKIPSIAMDEVVVEGVGPLELNAGPGHYPGSVLPGAVGNAIISAHRDRHFRRVAELAVGDTVLTETLFGARVWLVAERRVVDRAEASLFATSDPTLTLTTCWPVRYLGPAPDRLLIIAKPVESSLQG